MPTDALLKPSRDIRLDLMRGIAVLLVIFSHLIIPDISPAGVSGHFIRFFWSVLKFIRTGGWIGVDLFFVLSGFLVSGLLFQEFKKTGEINPYQFLIRRGFKIYPVFYTFLLLTFLIDFAIFKLKLPALYNYESIKQQVLLYTRDAFFLNNYWPGRWPHTWSLDVEELFYILLVFYFLLLIKWKKLNYRNILYAWAVLLLLGILFRTFACINHPGFNFGAQYAKSHFRLDALLFGVLLSWLYHYSPERFLFFKRYNFFLITLSIAWLLTNFLFARFDNSWIAIVSLGVNPVCFGVLLMGALNSNAQFLRYKILAYIGRVSYATYLWHVFINMCFIAWVPSIKDNTVIWALYAICYLLFSILIGAIFTHLVEAPLLNLRNRYFPSSTSPETNQ
ncbi:acyltransferase family protein [Mucilaginibacter sp. RCC_168]|uniref:acyltransferase family protein n=1 Tax=Mucilaginibacter sp. RCC_168 TaxID=3239221 RepID=UPI0035261D38